jgi:hypothetical protein
MMSGEICVTSVAPATRKDWDETMHLFYSSLPIILYVAALILGFFGVRLPGGAGDLGPLAHWVLFLALGVMSLWSAYSHAFATELVARSIGWPPSPFQKEIAGANLGIGLGAIAAAFIGRPAGWAIFVVASSFLWSAAATHVWDMVKSKNFAINNAGPIFWWDIITPLTLLILLVVE